MNRKQMHAAARIASAAAMLVAIHLAHIEEMGPALTLAAYLVPYLIVGHDVLLKAIHGIRSGQIFDENFLMSAATIGAFALALNGGGDYLEAVAVMLFYQVGELFQSVAVDRSRRSIASLVDIRPDRANVERDGVIESVAPDEVEIGSIIVVRPGERVPIDGVVVSGSSTLDTSALTGESAPREAGCGDEVLSGCVNMSGLLRVRTTREFGESTASKILDLVENAASLKARPEEMISRFARIYTPAVCIGALLLAVVPPVVSSALFALPPEWGVWAYRALTFLVISCPCALVVSVPLTFFAGIGGASSQGVLVKGANFIDSLSRAACVVFDKTGTLTCGELVVRDVKPRGMDAARLIDLAAHAESASSHPIARCIVRAHGSPLDLSRVGEVREAGGLGIIATVDGADVAVGSARLMREVGAAPDEADASGTVIYVAVGGEYAGRITASDAPKPTARAAVDALRRAGVARIVMLTGDSRAAAEAVASELGIDECFSDLLPGDKLERAEALMRELDGRGTLVFVGDGINDAPVLARADVGAAMGAMGSDAAIEAADVVLMDDDPMTAARAVRISRQCMGIVYQNIIFATGVKFACLVLGATGTADLWLAVFADVGVMVLAVLNAMRALFVGRSAEA